MALTPEDISAISASVRNSLSDELTMIRNQYIMLREIHLLLGLDEDYPLLVTQNSRSVGNVITQNIIIDDINNSTVINRLPPDTNYDEWVNLPLLDVTCGDIAINDFVEPYFRILNDGDRVFDLTHVVSENSETVSLNGSVLTNGADYEIVNNRLILNNAWNTKKDWIIRIQYSYTILVDNIGIGFDSIPTNIY